MKRQVGPVRRANPMVIGRRELMAALTASGRRCTETPTLGEAIRLLLEAKKKANYRAGYLVSVRQYLTMFARGRENMPLTDITEALIEAWFDSRTEALISKKGSLGRLSSLLSYAVRRGWIGENPIDFMEKIRSDQIVPPILTVRQTAKILVYTRRERPLRLAGVVLMLMIGLRPDEARQMTWPDVDLVRGLVRVAPAISKVRRRRVVHMMPAALAWMRLARDLGAALPTPKTGARRWLRRVRNMLGWRRWKQDVMRHTAASYWVAEWRDHGRVAYELGHSADQLRRHYLELVSEEDAKRFWALIPRTREEANQRRIKALEEELKLAPVSWRLAS